MIRQNSKLLISALFLVLFTSSSLLAQGSFGSIRGVVTDTSGAVVPGANVEVRNEATNELRTSQTNTSGEYSVSNLVPGLYTVSVKQPGFAAAISKGVRISVAFTTESNLLLNAAGAQEIVTVTTGDAATQLNTTDQQLSTIIGNQKIMDLPLLSRDPSSLVLLAPGTVQTDSGLGGFSVNGSRERNNNFLVDGIDNNDTDVPGIPGGVATPNIDATEEFRIISLNANAEYGRNTGGTIATVTKHGTNHFSGNLYEYFRSDQFAARNFFDTTGHADPLKRNQYGGSIGGPVVRDRLFFFFNYEGNRSSSGGPQYRSVPTAAARTGIFTTANYGTLDIRPNGANNASGSVLTGGPNLPFSPTALSLLSLFPLPNYPVNGAIPAPLPGLFELYRFNFVAKDRVDSFATRVDWKFNKSNTVTFSANYGKGDYNFGPPTFDTFNDELRTPQLGGVYALSVLSNFGSSVVNELRLGTNRVDAQFNGQGSGGVSDALNSAVRSAFNAHNVGIPTFGDSNGDNLNIITPFTSINNFDTQGRKTGTTTLGDSLTWIRGDHILKFGAEGRFVYSNGDSDFGRAETINTTITPIFGGAAGLAVDNQGNTLGVDPVTGLYDARGALVSDYLSFLSGFVSEQVQTQFFDKNGQRTVNDYRRYRTNEYGIFAQDSWRVRPSLTLNFGLRYEYNTTPYEKNGLLSNLVSQDPSGVTPTGGFLFQTVGKNSDNPNIPLYESDKNNFGPRLGFAWSPGFDSGFLKRVFGGPGKSSIRGGFGIFYDRVFTNLFSNTSGNLPFSANLFVLPIFDLPGFTIDNVPRLSNGTPTSHQLNGDEGAAVIFPTAQNNIYQQKFVTPSSNAWNFGMERDFGGNFVFEINYVGTKGIHLIRDLNAQLTSVARVNALTGSNNAISADLRTNYLNGSLNTAFGQNSAFLIVSTGNSIYNSMQVRLTKTLTNQRFGRGQFEFFYTLSHSIDDAPDSLVPGTSDRSLPRDSSGYAGGLALERGDSSFDARHVFSLNFIYELPFFQGTGWRDRLLGHWSISGIARYQTGYPYSIFMNGVDRQGTGLTSRASYATGSNALTSTQSTANARTYTGPSRTLFASDVPLDGSQGTVPRGAFRGPAYQNEDFSLIKRFPINEKMRFTIRADFFNIFNLVNFGVPISDVEDPNFGVSTFAGRPRIIQFAGRLDF